MFDNKLLNINGGTKELLNLALQIAFAQEHDKCKATSWLVTKEFGFILSWCSDNSPFGNESFVKFPLDMSSNLMTDLIWDWLQTTSPTAFKLQKWEGNVDHDGDNSIGWRVYVEDWGNIGHCSTVICAIKPVYLWHGK